MQADKNNRLVHNFFSLGFVQVINSSLQLLVIPYVINKVGADGFGVIAVCQVVMLYLSTFTDYGFYQSATRSIAIEKTDAGKISRIFSNVLYAKLILCILSFLLLLVLTLIIPFLRGHLSMYLLAFTIVIGQSLLINWFFQGMEKMWFIVLTTLIGRLLFVALVFLFIKNKGDDFLFLFFMGIGNMVAGGLSIVIAYRLFHLRLVNPGRSAILQELKDGWHFTVSNLSMNICQYSNVVILRLFTNDLVVGYYSVAERIFFAVKQGLVVFSQSVYPGICQLIDKGKNHYIAFLKKVYLPFLLCVIAGSIGLLLFSEQVLFFFSGKEAVHSVFFLRMFCIVLVIICLNIPSTLALLALNKKKSYFRVYTLGGLVNIISGVILVYFFNSTGTIIAIFITEIFITAAVLYESNRQGMTITKTIH